MEHIRHMKIGIGLWVVIMGFGVSASAVEEATIPLGYQHIGNSDCFGCHRYDSRLVGPAFKDVAERYREDPAAPQKLVKKIREGGAGNWGPIPMAPHPTLTDEQLRQIVQWILSGQQPPTEAVPAQGPAIALPTAPAEAVEYKHLIRVEGLAPITHLPPPPVPADNPMTEPKVALGRLLFFDGRLSGDGRSSCFVCHNPQLGWGDGGGISRGYPGSLHWRNSQTLLNSAHYNKLFWDSSSMSLETQAKSAATGGVGGNGDESMLEMRLRFIPEYVEAFRAVFGTDQPRMKQTWMAIAAFERTLVSDPKQVPYDRYIAGDQAALSDSAQRGMKLFHGKAGCVACHNGPLASDQKLYALGVPENPQVQSDPLAQITHRYEQYIKGMAHDVYAAADRDHGLYYVTKHPRDKGKFRTPSLRELRYTGPYMHNGMFTTLEQVIDFYDAGGGEAANKSPLLRPLGLSAQDKQDLIVFLEALSMEQPLTMPIPPTPPYQPLEQESTR